MPKTGFLTLDADLIETANAAKSHLEERGFKVRIEHRELSFPFTPALVADRNHERHIIEVGGHVPRKRLAVWTLFCQSMSTDTRLQLVVPSDALPDARQEAWLRENGIGLIAIASTGDAVKKLSAKDAGVNIQLPPLGDQPLKIRQSLGHAFEQVEDGNWREGFVDACQAVEVASRAYLKRGLKTARISVLKPNGSPRPLSAKQVDRMTLGQLAMSFANIRSPNYDDGQLANGLEALNRDRPDAAHHKWKKATENRLRKNVGQHMWLALRLLGILFS